MKKMMTFFVAVLMTAMSMSLNAQTVTVDSVNHTNSSAIMQLLFTNVTDTIFVRGNFGDSAEVNEFWTVGYMVTPGTTSLDIPLSNLLPNTTYSCAGFIYYPIMVMSPVVNFTTDACALTVNVSSVVLNSCSEQLTATSGLNSYQWYRNGAIISGATSSVYVVSNDGSYIVSVGDATCTGTSSPVTVDVNEITVTVTADQAICKGEQVTLTASGATTYVWSNSENGSSITVSPLSTTSYTVTGTSDGCSNTATSKVTVNPLPNVSISASEEAVCIGAVPKVEVEVSPAGGILSPSAYFSGNSFLHKDAGVGLHTVTYSYTDPTTGCSNSDGVSIDVMAEPVVSGVEYNNTNGVLTLTGSSFTYLIEVIVGDFIYSSNHQGEETVIFFGVPTIEVGEYLTIQSVDGGDGACFIMVKYLSVEELLLLDGSQKDKDTRIFNLQGQVVNVRSKSELNPGMYIQNRNKFVIPERNF